jgi:hypothetical protein
VSHDPITAAVLERVQADQHRRGNETKSQQGPISPTEDGATLLDDLAAFLGRFVAFPTDRHKVAVALWVVHAHALDAFESTPRLAFLSAEKQSGKTRALEVLELLCPTARHASSLTAAALFRLVASERPTLLFDEVDTIFGPSATQHEELRGLLNAGHRRGAVAFRCVGDPSNMRVDSFPAFAAVALAGLGDLPDTILDRSILIRMRRRAPDETVEAFRRRYVMPVAEVLRSRLAGWAADVAGELAVAEPPMPPGVTDRPADCWEALLAIADRAGRDWPERAREAAIALIGERQNADPSLGIRLLGDLRAVFGEQAKMRTSELVDALCAIEESPWGDLRGKPMDARGLARRLKPYGIRPSDHRFAEGTAKGYERSDFADSWRRYLPVPGQSATRATSEQPATDNRALTSGVAHVAHVAHPGEPESNVAHQKGDSEAEAHCRGCDRPTPRCDDEGQPWCLLCQADEVAEVRP